MSLFGIQKEKIITIEEPVFFEEIHVPIQKWLINKSPDHKIKETYDYIVKKVEKTSEDRAIFLTYKNKQASRVKNLAEVETSFEKFGFEIISPEDFSFIAQVKLYRNSKTIAGTSGTVLYNILFTDEGTNLLEIGDKRTPVDLKRHQAHANELKNANAMKIKYIPKKEEGDHIDIDHLEDELTKITKRLP